MIITNEVSWGNPMIQPRKGGETPPFQTNLRTWTELLTTEDQSRPHHGAITKGRGQTRAVMTRTMSTLLKNPQIVNADEAVPAAQTGNQGVSADHQGKV